MISNLSISKAWDETRSRLGADGRLYVTVALALIALPAAVGQFLVPGSGMTSSPQSIWEVIVMIAIWLIGLVGQLALIRLALGPSISVGEAIGHGLRRAPAYIGAVLLILLGMVIVSIPFVVALAALGVAIEPGTPPPPSAYIFLLLYVGLLLYLAVRLLLTSAVASAERGGPIAIIKRSWQMTSGHWLRLFGFLLLFIIGMIVFVGAIAVMTGLLVSMLFGPTEPMTVAALIIALVEAVASAIATTIFIVMLARIYVQLSEGPAAETTVPSSGT